MCHMQRCQSAGKVSKPDGAVWADKPGQAVAEAALYNT